MPRLRIDNREIEVETGATILDAARKLAVPVPTVCFREGHPPSASCMVCAVKVNGRERFVPACATKVADGMRVDSETEEVHNARRTALELLLGDHLGDCIGPCESACPAHVNIPQMIRQIAAGRIRDAVATVKRHVALPAVLGRICRAPCEKACRRGLPTLDSGLRADDPVSIRLLKRYAAEADLASGDPYLPECRPATGRRVAVVGAGPAGLSAAWYLLQQGNACTIFDDHERPGGMLRYGIKDDLLPHDLLDAEIGLIEKIGAEFQMRTQVGKDPSPADLRGAFDAVLIAAGRLAPEDARAFGLDASGSGVKIDKRTLAAGLPGVFAAGGAVSRTKMAARAMAAGRAAAGSIGQYLAGAQPTGARRPFSVHIGRLSDGEMERFMMGASGAGRVVPSGGARAGFTAHEAREEAARCLRCDCRKRDDCRLRDHAAAYGARAGRYMDERRTFEQETRHPDVIYEPGKCVACGTCVRITAEAGEPLGLTFVGRGFDVRVAAPFNSSLAEGLQKVARECVKACPTGALALKNSPKVKPWTDLKGSGE